MECGGLHYIANRSEAKVDRRAWARARLLTSERVRMVLQYAVRSGQPVRSLVSPDHQSVSESNLHPAYRILGRIASDRLACGRLGGQITYDSLRSRAISAASVSERTGHAGRRPVHGHATCPRGLESH